MGFSKKKFKFSDSSQVRVTSEDSNQVFFSFVGEGLSHGNSVKYFKDRALSKALTKTK